MTHTQRFSSLLFTLVFLTVKVCCVSVVCVWCVRCVCGEKLSVWQTPTILTTAPGEQVAITCHFTLRAMEEGRWKIRWRKRNDTEFKFDTDINISPRVSPQFNISPRVSPRFNASHRLCFPAESHRNSGLYYCTVWQDVPRLGPETTAEGTEIIVDSTFRKHVTNTTNTQRTGGWASASVSLLLLLVCVTAIIYCCTRRGRCVRRTVINQTSDSDVIYAVVKQEEKNTPEVCDVSGAGSDALSDVLYSEIRMKP